MLIMPNRELQYKKETLLPGRKYNLPAEHAQVMVNDGFAKYIKSNRPEPEVKKAVKKTIKIREPKVKIRDPVIENDDK